MSGGRSSRAGTRTGKLAVARKDGAPHVVPIWFVLDGDDFIFTTNTTTVKGKSLQRDGRAALCVDDERPPFAFVAVEGTRARAPTSKRCARGRRKIGARYMGEDRAEEFGRRNAVEGELLVRLTPAACRRDRRHDRLTG